MAERETAQQRMDRLVQQSAGMNFGMQDDTFFGMMHNLKRSGVISNEEMMELSDKYAETGELVAQGRAAGSLGSVADLGTASFHVLKNIWKMGTGGNWEWPEDFRNVPATSDWWGKQMGLTKEQTDSWAFIGGSMTSLPKAVEGLDAALIGKIFDTTAGLVMGERAVQGAQRVAKRIRAQELVDQGVSDTDVWRQTGWFPSVDDTGKKTLRFYISDYDATVNYDALTNAASSGEYKSLSRGPGTVTMKMSELLDHPQLYQYYPEIADYPITVNFEKLADGTIQLAPVEGRTVASFDPVKRKFRLYGKEERLDPVQSLLHEAQHAVQTIEDWTNGASTRIIGDALSNYHTAVIMERAYKNPERFLELDQDEYFKLFRGLDKEEEQALYSELQRMLVDATEGVPDEAHLDRLREWSDIKARFQGESERWMQHLALADEKELFHFVDTTDPMDLQMLVAYRYHFDLGEMEARLTEALHKLPQEKIDMLPVSPHEMMGVMYNEDQWKVFKQFFPEAERMKYARPVYESFDPGSKAASIAEQRLDLFIKPEYSLGEKVHVPMLKNPGPTELERFLGDTGIGNEQLRWMVNEGDLYVWEASAALHDDAAKALELPTIEGFTSKINLNKTGAGDISPKELINVLWERSK